MALCEGVGAFHKETACRRSSQLTSMASTLRLAETQAKQAKMTLGVPKPPDQSHYEKCAQVCGVLTPHLVGTRTIDHDSEMCGGASSFIPVWRGVMRQLGSTGKIPKPEKCGPWGYQEGGAAYYPNIELLRLCCL